MGCIASVPRGAGSEPIQVWDPDRSILSAYRELFHFQSMMFEIAADNRARGYRPMPLFELLRMTRRYNRLLDARRGAGSDAEVRALVL